MQTFLNEKKCFKPLLKRERVKKRIYSTRGQASADIFNYIEMFYHVKRKHGSNNLISPVNFKNQYQEQVGCG
jgi:putative transposase